MSATTAPVTTGGISQLMKPEPQTFTAAPTRKNTAPAMQIPARAEGIPPTALAAITGAMNAKLLPR